MNIDFKNPTTKILIFIVILFIVLISILIYFLTTSKPISPTENIITPTVMATPTPTIQIINKSENGDIIYFVDTEGNNVIEIKDPDISEQEAKDILDLPPEMDVKFIIPGAALPKALTLEYQKPPEELTENIDFNEWGLDPNHNE